MWLRSKPKNRRLEREQVLDVKVRSSLARTARARTAAIALGVAFATVFGAYLLWRAGEWALDRLVYQNKAFAIHVFDIQTDGVIAIPQLRRWAGVKPEQNLLALDLARVKRDLELVPLIQSVSVERILPHTLRLRVAEREPIAQIQTARSGANGALEVAVYRLDAEGWVMVPLGSPSPWSAGSAAAPASDKKSATVAVNPQNDSLPLLCGLRTSDLQPGRRLEAPQVQAALQLIVCFDESPMAGLADLKRIDVSAPEILIATTGQGGVVTFGWTDLDQQLRRWHEIFVAGQRLSRAIATLDLAVSNSVPARWLEASALPPTPPKPRKPSGFKKKHV